METINVSQLPVTGQHEILLRWILDEYHVAYNRRTQVLTVEEFDGFTDDGEEETRVCAEAEALDVLRQYQPGWVGLDGFVKLLDYYGGRWTIGTEAI